MHFSINNFPLGKASVNLEWVKLKHKDGKTIELYFNADKEDFNYANDFCTTNGGELYEPKIEDDNEDVSKAANDKGIKDFWIGIQYSKSNSRWEYVSDKSVVANENTLWGPNEATYDEVSACVQRGYHPDYKWDAIPCNTNLGFVCERIITGQYLGPFTNHVDRQGRGGVFQEVYITLYFITLIE